MLCASLGLDGRIRLASQCGLIFRQFLLWCRMKPRFEMASQLTICPPLVIEHHHHHQHSMVSEAGRSIDVFVFEV